MKLGVLFFAFSLASTLVAVDPPISIRGTMISMVVEERVGSHLLDGTLLVLFDDDTDGYVSISINYGLFDSGTYEYAVMNGVGRLSTASNSGGTLNYKVEFNTVGKGSFELVDNLYVQKGKFNASWWFHPDDSPTVSLKNVITSIDAEELSFTIQVEKSTDLEHWSPAEGSWEFGENGKATFKYANPEKSVFLRVSEP